MIPAMNRPERAAFLAFVREGAPAEAFDAMLDRAARPPLTPPGYEALELALAV
jgi:hypothetical protein